MPPAPAKPVCHGLDIQCDIGAGSLEARAGDADPTLTSRRAEMMTGKAYKKVMQIRHSTLASQGRR